MPQSKSPRKLGDISHLFLSTGASEAGPERRRAEAVIWLAASGRSVNRAHLAAGLASAVARQGIFVSLLEVSRGLPTIGYYFGMEPIDHLAPSLDRSRLVAGLWSDAVRYCMSADPRSFGRWRPEPVPAALPHALVAAFPRPAGERETVFFEELRRAIAPFVEAGGSAPGAPDALIVAGGERGGLGDGTFVARSRSMYPEALIVRVRRGSADLDGADEGIEIPATLVSSWARRIAPADSFFNDLASGLFQVLSRRRRALRDAAAG